MDIEYGVKTENKFSIVNTLDDEALDPSDILKKLESINAKDDKTTAAKKKNLQKKPITGVNKTGTSTVGTKGDKLAPGKTKESTDKENKISGSSSSVSRNVDSSQNKRFPRGGSAQNTQSPRNRLPRQERSNIPPRFRQTTDNDQAFQNGAAQQFGGGFLNRGYAPNEEQQLGADGGLTDNAVGGQPGFGTGFGTGFNVEEGEKDAGYRTRVFGRGGRRFNNGFRDRGGYTGDPGPRGRQFDRQSGSDKTGIKPIDKREGSGAHNWGSANRTDDLMAEGGEAEIDVSANNEELAAKPEDFQQNGGEFENAAEPEAEPEPVQLTLDEWKALQEPRSKPAFNVRRAGEGEKEKSEWKKLVPLKGDDLNKKKKKAKKEEIVVDEEEEEEEEDAQKLLPIDINFIGDAYRGGRGRGRGRGGRGAGFGGGRGTGFGRGNDGRGTTRDRQSDVPYTIDDETFPSLK